MIYAKTGFHFICIPPGIMRRCFHIFFFFFFFFFHLSARHKLLPYEIIYQDMSPTSNVSQWRNQFSEGIAIPRIFRYLHPWSRPQPDMWMAFLFPHRYLDSTRGKFTGLPIIPQRTDIRLGVPISTIKLLIIPGVDKISRELPAFKTYIILLFHPLFQIILKIISKSVLMKKNQIIQGNILRQKRVNFYSLQAGGNQ